MVTNKRGKLNLKVLSHKIDRFIDPESVFMNLYSNEDYGFWLDSSFVEKGLSRFSFMGTNDGPLSKIISYKKKKIEVVGKDKKFIVNKDIFSYLKAELNSMYKESNELPFDFNGGFVGYFGYELKGECGALEKHTSESPDAMFIFVDRFIAFDHEDKCMYLVNVTSDDNYEESQKWFVEMENKIKDSTKVKKVSVESVSDKKPIEFKFAQNHDEYINSIKKCKELILDGETYEVCLTNRINANEKINPLDTYRVLREINPAPYSAFIKFKDFSILSSSPERFLKIDKRGVVEAKPIKGTIRRSFNEVEDLALAEKLRMSEKDRAENLMIVDLLRNDLGRVCEVGSIKVPKLMAIESYETVHQLVSTISGQLRNDLTAIDCIKASFPGGSMTGAPKIRTMKFIDELETDARGIYSGSIGFLGLNGTVDLNIVIRTIIAFPDKATIGVGGAVTILSDYEGEFNETILKGKALIKAIVLAKYGEFNDDLYRLEGYVV